MILQTARCLLAQSNLEIEFWEYAILVFMFTINRLPNSILKGNSSLELLYKRKLDYSILKTFKCSCFPLKLSQTSKLHNRLVECIYLGYSSYQKGYKSMDLKLGKIIISRHVRFLESDFPYKNNSTSQNNKSLESSFNILPLTNK